MTVTDQIKILDRKIMQNEAQYDLDRTAAKISALSSNNLDKYELLTGEDLGLKPSTVEQAKFEYSPLGMSLSKAFKKDEVKSVAKSKSDFNYDSKYAFYRFYKGYDEFKEMSLDSKYNRMKDFNKLLISFKSLKTKKKEKRNTTQKGANYEKWRRALQKYYNAYKNDYDTDDELKEDKKKKFDYKQFELKNKKTTRRSAIKKISNIISDLDQQRQEKSTVFQNKMIDVAYYLFNAFGISTKPDRLMVPKWVNVSEERFNDILSTVTKTKSKAY